MAQGEAARASGPAVAKGADSATIAPGASPERAAEAEGGVKKGPQKGLRKGWVKEG